MQPRQATKVAEEREARRRKRRFAQRQTARYDPAKSPRTRRLPFASKLGETGRCGFESLRAKFRRERSSIATGRARKRPSHNPADRSAERPYKQSDEDLI